MLLHLDVDSLDFIVAALLSFGSIVFLGVAIKSWKNIFLGKRGLMPVSSTFLLTIFIIFYFFLNYYMIQTSNLHLFSLLLIGIFCLLALVNFLFYYLLKAPTFIGRKMLDKIEGFKLYLNVAEKDRINQDTSLQEKLKIFQLYLPYALALDVEQRWTKYFSDALLQANANRTGYLPLWFDSESSKWDNLKPADFISSLSNSFSAAIASSSVPPGSNSGSDWGGDSSGGGGGSSGGGGGGGGGGGW